MFNKPTVLKKQHYASFSNFIHGELKKIDVEPTFDVLQGTLYVARNNIKHQYQSVITYCA